MRRFSKAFRPVVLAVLVLVLLSLPGAGLQAAQEPQGFILLSAGKDGTIGTDDDIYVTGKGEAVKGKADLASLGLAQMDLVPSNVRVGEIQVTADPQSAPADGRTAVRIRAVVRDAGGKPVPDGTAVTFSATLGTLSAVSARTSNGEAAVTLVSNSPGPSTVTASCGGRAAQISVSFNALTQVISTGGKLYIWMYAEVGKSLYSQPWSPPKGWRMIRAHVVTNRQYCGDAYVEGWDGSRWVTLVRSTTYPYNDWVSVPANITQLRTHIVSYLNSDRLISANVPEVEVQLSTE